MNFPCKGGGWGTLWCKYGVWSAVASHRLASIVCYSCHVFFLWTRFCVLGGRPAQIPDVEKKEVDMTSAPEIIRTSFRLSSHRCTRQRKSSVDILFGGPRDPTHPPSKKKRHNKDGKLHIIHSTVVLKGRKMGDLNGRQIDGGGK